jgi:hypothetical protein
LWNSATFESTSFFSNRNKERVSTVNRYIVLFLFVAMMALAGCGGEVGDGATALFTNDQAPAGTGYVTGIVKGAFWVPEGNPVHSIENVAIDHKDGDDYAVSTQTEDDGSFSLSLPAGTHTISLSKEGYASRELPVTVEAGKTTVATAEAADFVVMKPAPMPKAKWTVMYYIDVNNDLFGCYTWHGIGGEFYFGLEEVNEPNDQRPGLKDTLQDGINVVVFCSPTPNDSPFYKNSTMTVINNKTKTTVRKDWDGDSQEAYKTATLKEFINEAMATYPAEHYMLCMENHGGGIYGICFEGSNHISMKDLGDILREVNKNKQEHIEIVSFSACIMGMFEVAYELKDTNVDYLVDFETNGDPHGFPVHGQYVEGIDGFFVPSQKNYPFTPQIGDAGTKDKIKWLTHITTREARETAQLLCYEQFAQSMQIQIAPSDENPQGSPFCAAAIDLKKFSEKGGAADIFVNSFARDVVTINPSGLKREAQKMYTGSSPGHMYAADYIDLRDFSHLMATEVGSNAARQLEDALMPSFLFSSNQKTTVSNEDGRALMAVSQYNNARCNGLSVLMGKYSNHSEIKELQIYQDCRQWYDYWDQF